MNVCLKSITTAGSQVYSSAVAGLSKIATAITSVAKSIFNFIGKIFSGSSNANDRKTTKFAAFGFGSGLVSGVMGLPNSTPVLSLLFSKPA